jgi:hypothetical protein
MLVTDLHETLVVLVSFLGFYWLSTGVLALVQVFVDRAVPWIWPLLGGILGIAAGVLVLKHPLLATLTVPTLLIIVLGVEGLFMGLIEIMRAFQGGGIGSSILGVVNLIVGLLLLGSPVAGGAGNSDRIRRASICAGRGAHHMGVPRPRMTKRFRSAPRTGESHVRAALQQAMQVDAEA